MRLSGIELNLIEMIDDLVHPELLAAFSEDNQIRIRELSYTLRCAPRELDSVRTEGAMMDANYSPVRGADWNLSEYADVFEKFGKELYHRGMSDNDPHAQYDWSYSPEQRKAAFRSGLLIIEAAQELGEIAAHVIA